MANENPLPLAPPTGVCYSSSPYSQGKDVSYVGSGPAIRIGTGRWDDARNMEFIAGFPQKIAGWTQAVQTPLAGIPRAQAIWRDAAGLARVAIGTTNHLYSWQAGVATDITPAIPLSTGTLSGPITTVGQSQIVAIADNTQVLANGDWVFVSAASAVGGITLNGWYQVQNRTGTGYNITFPVAASSSVGPAGGTTAFKYPRINLSNPFTTTLGLAAVNVNHSNHGRVVGNYVDFTTGAPVGGLTLTGDFPVTGVVDVNNYMITAPAVATSGVANAGGTVSAVYSITVQQTVNSALPVWGASGVVWGAVGTSWGTGGQTPAVLADGWTLADYGSQMLAAPIGGTIYVFDSGQGGRAYPLLNAPGTLNAMFVTAERFVVALGINGNLMQMAWADQNDYTQWTTTPTNTALTGRTLSGGNYFVGGKTVTNGLALLWTNSCVFTMNYTAGQEIYSTLLSGDNCGLVSPWAMCVEGMIAYWMSDQDWWNFNGSPAALPSDDVRASVFQGQPYQRGLNRSVLNKAVAVLNRTKKQVRFYYPSAIASENDGGFIFQFDTPSWSPLGFGRSAGTDSKILQTPVSCDKTGLMYYDETGVDANGTPLSCFIQMSPVDVSNGQQAVDIFGFIPDFDYLIGTVVFNSLATYYPDGPMATDGPWQLTANSLRQDLRLDGRMFAFSIALNGLGWTMRLGLNRLDIQSSGARV